MRKQSRITMKLSKNVVLDLIIVTIASCGLIFQVFNISERYFQFKTRTVIILENPIAINIPTLSTCWDLEDILDVQKINQETNISFPNWDEFKYKNYSAYWNAVKQLTVADYFKYTPSNESILQKLQGCIIRTPKTYVTQHPWPSNAECYKIFSIQKYLHRGMMCYLFSVKGAHDVQVYVENYSLAPQISGMLFTILFDKELFGNVGYYSAFLHGNDTSMLYDSVFNSMKFFFRNVNISINYLNLEVVYSSVKTHFLPYPYETKCVDTSEFRSSGDQWFCKLRKLIIKDLNLVDTFVPVFDSYPLPILGPEYLINSSITSRVNKIIESINGADPPPNTCFMHYYISRQTVGYSGNIAIGVYWPEDTFTSVTHVEDQGLIDFIVYICSSIGIWFGLSFWSGIKLLQTFLLRKKSKIIDPSKVCKSCDTRIKALLQYTKIIANEHKREINLLKSMLRRSR